MRKIWALALAILVLAGGIVLIPALSVVSAVMAGSAFGLVFAILCLGVIALAGALLGAIPRGLFPDDPGRRNSSRAGWIAAFVFLGGWSLMVYNFMMMKL